MKRPYVAYSFISKYIVKIIMQFLCFCHFFFSSTLFLSLYFVSHHLLYHFVILFCFTSSCFTAFMFLLSFIFLRIIISSQTLPSDGISIRWWERTRLPLNGVQVLTHITSDNWLFHCRTIGVTSFLVFICHLEHLLVGMWKIISVFIYFCVYLDRINFLIF